MATRPSGRVELLPAKRQALILDHLPDDGIAPETREALIRLGARCTVVPINRAG
jgi:hypothetical protein